MIQIDLDKIVPIEDLPNKLNQVVDDAHGGAIFVVTKEDRPAVAIVSIDQLEGLSGRKVITPMSEPAPEPPPPLPPAPLTGQAESTAPPPPPASDLATPTTSVQRDLTPGATPPPPPAPPPSTATPPPPAPPDKPLDEMPL